MKICRFNDNHLGDNRLGVLSGDEILDVTQALDAVPTATYPYPSGDMLIAHLDAVIQRIMDLAPGAARRKLDTVKLLSPVANPNKIIGAPVNYQKHIDEARADAAINFGSDVKSIDHYGVFLKASSSLVGPGEGVALRFTDRRNDHEAELAVIIGTTGSNIPESEALDYVAGYAIGLDMTVRGTEERSLRKSIDSYSVLGPWLVTADEIDNPDNLDFSLHVGDDLRQQANTEQLIFKTAKLIAYCASFYTLYPGDIIMTGTPAGVAAVEDGDVMHVTFEKIGTMSVPISNAVSDAV